MIGKLNQRITIQRAVKTDDGGGGFNFSWQSVVNNPSVYAAIQPLSAGESFQFSKLEFKASHRIIIRYREDITTEMKIVSGDKSYTIKAVQDIQGLKNYLEIIVNEEG